MLRTMTASSSSAARAKCARTHDEHRSVRRWLWVVLAMIFAMVLIGGITRLTGSGLSMVEWQPLIGAVPPLSSADWESVFARYRETPQFRLVNHAMGLEEFQRIFFWEYLHRLVGRLVGVVFAVPFLYFLIRRRMTKRLAAFASVAFVLGSAQGALGWYMVASGLVDVPAVSHYRLAAHLMLALATAAYVLWLGLQLRPQPSGSPEDAEEAEPPASRLSRAAIAITTALLLVQIAYGAFMAGTHAGHVASTFPDMNGRYAPAPFFTRDSMLRDLVEAPAAIHWTHRALAWLLLAASIALFALARSERRSSVRRAALTVLIVAMAQLTLGAITVMWHVAIAWAAAHQAGAFVLLMALVWLACEAQLAPRLRF